MKKFNEIGWLFTMLNFLKHTNSIGIISDNVVFYLNGKLDSGENSNPIPVQFSEFSQMDLAPEIPAVFRNPLPCCLSVYLFSLAKPSDQPIIEIHPFFYPQ